MKDFTFIKSLNETKEEKISPSTGINYQEFFITLEEKELKVLIPLRESDNFEEALSENIINTTKDLTKLLRQFRGIRG